ncbi:hypothetical protein MNR02_08625 [Shinella sp. H4-D48]|uniref:hypothetical protein n=1 Tax=Shinella sp. H4-D48 TaxID=2925841 RepID=UPI001F536629|nr:hypothetical protein [Shinella sp. H4-D48]UNK36578.1 hypothetical protein MNR02_08625 [Shinella sp. H4-D48]
MVTENTTPNRGYQEPEVGNTLEVDVGRLIAALRAIDTDMASAFAAIVIKAGLNSPAFTGTPTAPTAAPGTDSGQLATTAFVKAALAALVDSAPGALDTLNELAAALGDDPNFAATMTALIGTKMDVGALTADSPGRAKMADGFVNTDKLANGALSADTAGRAKMADGFLTAVKAAADFVFGQTAKTMPVDADAVLISDSATSNVPKKMTFANLKAWILSFIPLPKYYVSDPFAVVSGGSFSLTHTLGVEPKFIALELVVTSAVNGYAAGDKLHMGLSAAGQWGTGNTGYFIRKVGTAQISGRFGNNAGGSFVVANDTSGAPSTIPNANIQAVVRAWA